MKIVVTGGAGFIGSAVCRFLIGATDCEVVNVDKLTYAGNLASLKTIEQDGRYKFVHADVCDFAGMRALFDAEKPDAVMHLAAESHVDRSITGAGAFIQTNVVGTFSLLEAARGYLADTGSGTRERFRFLHVSTDEVYGSLGEDGTFSETTAYDPSSPYSASKAAADHLVMAWHRTYGLPAIISNCSNNYGPYHFPEKFIPLMILNALEGKPLPVYGDGSNVRDWLYVEDHAQALYAILTRGRPGEKYNVGGGNERTNIAVARQICAVLDRHVPRTASHDELIAFVPDRPGHDYRYAINAAKLKQELGWQAVESFQTGIEKTVIWYIENAWWWHPLRQKVYSGHRLGLVSDRTTTTAK